MKKRHSQWKSITLWSFLLFFCSLQVMAQDKRITINVTNASLQEVFKQIERQTTYRFSYRNVVLDDRKDITVSVTNAPVVEVLDSVLKGRNLQYQIISSKTIVISDKQTKEKSSAGSKVTGVVKDTNGEPIIGANVMIKGTSIGTITDIDGKFTLDAPANATMQVSYIGYMTTDVKASGKQQLDILLKEDTELLDEVVVVGYGTQKKVNLTGSVASVNFKEVSNVPMANTASMLQGRLPGVVLQSQGAQPGADTPEIRVRGVGTLGSSSKNDPMVLIDGVEASISDMANIAPADIESVSVLKDAASAAIYGVRAANGVILVTTKRGEEMTPSITYQGNITWQSATVQPDFVNSYEWAKMYNETHPGNAYTDEMLQKLKDGSDPDNFANTDWIKELFRTATMQQHHLSLSGGSKSVHYMFSGQYQQQDGIMIYTGKRQYNFRSNIDAKLGRIKLGMLLSGGKQEVDQKASSPADLMNYYKYLNPTIPARHANGHYGFIGGNKATADQWNPLADADGSFKKSEYNRFDGQLFAEVDLVKGLKFRSSLAYKYQNNPATSYTPRTLARYDADGNLLQAEGAINTLNKYNYLYNSYLNENILTYNENFGRHTIGLLLGHSVQQTRYEQTLSSRQGFPTDNIFQLNGGTQNDAVSGYAIQNRIQSFFGRVNYNYDARYLFEFNIRRDGSSRFSSDNRYATFPSLSGAWNIANEQFMPKWDWLSLLKVRASWGKLGNQEIGDYAYAPTLAANANYYFGDGKNIGMAANKVANDKIKWETTSITDFGLDASFLDGRISATFDWYNKQTNDILLQLPMPISFLGNLSAPYQNVGKVRNRGWELSANYQDGRGDWTWQAGFSLSKVSNEVIDYNGQETINDFYIIKEGEPINAYYGYKCIGMYRTEADLQRTNADGKVITVQGQKPMLGDLMYEDLNGDGNISDADRQVIGNPFPKLQYSISLGGTYKNFYISTFWQGVGGVKRYHTENTAFNGVAGLKVAEFLDRYTPENPNGSMPRLGSTNNDLISSFWLKDCSYLRLKTLEVGYTFTGYSFFQTVGVKSVKLYLTGNNLLTFTSLKNYDPEKLGTTKSSYIYPNTKTFSLGAIVNF